jgi:hypothetical protein
MYVKDLTLNTPKTEFICSVIGSTDSGTHTHARGTWTSDGPISSQARTSTQNIKPKEKDKERQKDITLTDVMVCQLGSFGTYKMYLPNGRTAVTGEDIKCYIHKINDKENLADYLFLPIQYESTEIPSELLKNKNNNKIME